MIDANIKEIIKKALEEDIKIGDITTEATVPKNLKGKGEFLLKETGVLAGFEIAEAVFNIVDENLNFEKFAEDGDKISAGKIIAEVEGSAASILTAERTALNFFQRMSGIATAAAEYREKIKHTKAQIIDTRKTVPGLRMLDKLAVKLSGGKNHRVGLYDMFLIKDNHIIAAGSVKKAINACKEFKTKNNLSARIEVETINLEQVNIALECGVDVIMLDNYELDKMREAVKLINGKCKVEASGGINLATVKDIAETGVDFISVGALTHSVKALDISLNITTSI